MQDPKPRRRFQFSLRTFLIAVCILGVGGGLLGRLLLSNPKYLVTVLRLLTIVVPFLLAIVTIAVIGGRRRRWGLVAWGGVLLVTPILGSFGLPIVARFVGPSPNGLGMVSTPQLLTQRLPSQIDQPWVWNELKRRLLAGSLSQPDVDAAVKTLTAHMTKKRPQGWDQPVRWQGDFLKSAKQAGKISEPVLMAFCDALYGPKPVLQPLPRVRTGGSGFDIEVRYGSNWSDNSGIGVQLFCDVDRVLLDGGPVEVGRNHRNLNRWSGHCKGSWPAGDHKLTVELECAYLDQSKLIGLNTGNLPAERWPAARKRWTQSVSAPLKVYTADEPIVELSTDPSRDPRRTGGLDIGRVVVQADRDGRKKLIVQFAYTPGLAIQVSFDVSATLGDQTIKLGPMWTIQSRNSHTTFGNQLARQLETLDPSIRRADIILTPNPRHIESRLDVSAIWGETIVVEQVPIERLDLETTATDAE